MVLKFKWELLALICFFNCHAVNGSCSSGWTSYNDEKCLKVFDSEFGTYDQGINFCTSQKATLLTVRSSQEQAFVEKFVFDDNAIVDNVWLGAKRSLAGNFYWVEDSLVFGYSNWAEGAPSNDSEKECVQMATHLSKAAGDGFWSDVSCLSRKIVVCQAPSTLSLMEMQTILLETRKRVFELESNPVPVGFIYVQLASQPSPMSLWPTCNWTQITSNYSGLFFRAEGGKSLPFGNTQNEDSPRFTSASFVDDTVDPPISNASLLVGTASSYLWAGAHMNTAHDHNEGMRFLVTYTDTQNPEVRPKNSAVRIWIRTA